MCPLRRGGGGDGGARQTAARLQEGRNLTLIHKNRNVPRDESAVTCARRRTEVLLCLPSTDEHLLSNKDTSREEGREGKEAHDVFSSYKLNGFLDLTRAAERLMAEIKDF